MRAARSGWDAGRSDEWLPHWLEDARPTKGVVTPIGT